MNRLRNMATRTGGRILSLLTFSLAVVVGSVANGGDIHDAIQRGDVATVQKLLAKNPSLVGDDEKSRGETQGPGRGRPLNIAAELGNIEIVRMLLKRGADANAAGGDYAERPVFQTKTPNVVKLLAEHGADLSAQNESNQTPLQAAASRGLQAVARVLEAKGAKVDVRSAARLGWTPPLEKMLRRDPKLAVNDFELLFAAAGSGHTGVARLLLKHGANPNRNFGFFNVLGPYTPLSEAVVSGHYDVARLLCENGADPNVTAGRNHDNLLLYAAAYLDARFLKLLLEYRAEFKKCGALHVVAALGGARDAGWVQRWGQPNVPDWSDRQSIVKAQLLIDAGADVHATNGRYHATPLLFAAVAENRKLVTLLLARGAKYDVSSACALGNLAAVEKLLRDDPQLLKRTKHPFGRAPLHWAARSGNAELVKLLLARGGDINARAPGLEYQDAGGFDTSWEQVVRNGEQVDDKTRAETPLHVALVRGHTGVAQLLINKGADLNALDANDRTPLMVAAANHNLDAMGLLVAKGVDVNRKTKDDWTALHEAVKDLATVAFLLKSGAKANVGPKGDSPLQLAADSHNHRDVAELLLRHGAPLDLATACALNKREWIEKRLKAEPKLLHAKYTRWLNVDRLIEIASRSGSLDVVTFLISQGALQPPAGVRVFPLHFAAANGHGRVVDLLIQHGLSLEAKDAEGRTPLHHAAMAFEPDGVKRLLKRGANVKAVDNDGNTPLHLVGGNEWAALIEIDSVSQPDRVRFEREVTRLLVQAGASLQARNGKGRTPLHLAAGKGQIDVAEALLKKGATVNAFDWSLQTPLAVAEHKLNGLIPAGIDRRPVAALLKKHGGVK